MVVCIYNLCTHGEESRRQNPQELTGQPAWHSDKTEGKTNTKSCLLTFTPCHGTFLPSLMYTKHTLTYLCAHGRLQTIAPWMTKMASSPGPDPILGSRMASSDHTVTYSIQGDLFRSWNGGSPTWPLPQVLEIVSALMSHKSHLDLRSISNYIRTLPWGASHPTCRGEMGA